MNAHPSNNPPAAASETSKARWTILALLSIAQFMVVLDATVVNVALPSIGTGLGFAPNDLQWVITAYVLFTGGFLLLGGRLADYLGRRPVFLAGLVVFTVASLTSAMAPTATALIVSRAAQGLGAAMLSPSALSIVTTTYHGEQRTTALSIWGAISAGGAAAGVLVGGLLTTWFGWQSVFFINVPVGVVTALMVLRHLPATDAHGGALRRLDVPGALTVISGLVSLVYAIEGISTHGWTSPRTLVLFAVSGALFGAFAGVERRAPHPLVPPATWKARSLVSSATVFLGATGLLVGAFFLNSMFLQNVVGASALETGLDFLPLVVVIAIAAHVAPHALTHIGARGVVIGGLTLIAVGFVLLSGVSADASYLADVLPGFLLIGFGVGLTMVTAQVTAMSKVQHETAGLASGFMTTAHEIGAALGVAVFSAIAVGTGVAAAGQALADGYGAASLTGAGIAVALAVVSAAAVPRFRPIGAQRAAIH